MFIDLQKAFDSLNHDLLLYKLHYHGIRGLSFSWLKSYLTNRQQFVQINEQKSDLKKIVNGIPQGSVLGPLLFVLFINDICNVSKRIQIILFADDTSIYYTGKDLTEMIETTKIELRKIKKWFHENKLSINWKKTKFMIFSNSQYSDITLDIDQTTVQKLTELKFLGVLLDEKLKWKSNITYLQQKISKILFKVKDLFKNNSLRMLYCAFVLPYLSYCVEVWGKAYPTHTKLLILLQKRAIRIINNKGRKEHTNALFAKSCLLKFPDLVDLKMFMLKAKLEIPPHSIQSLFVPTSEDGSSRRKFYFKVPFARTTLRQTHISIQGICLWNSVDLSFKQCTNAFQFKKIFKDKILHNYLSIESR